MSIGLLCSETINIKHHAKNSLILDDGAFLVRVVEVVGGIPNPVRLRRKIPGEPPRRVKIKKKEVSLTDYGR